MVQTKLHAEAYAKHCKINGENATTYQNFIRRLRAWWSIETAILTWNVKGSQYAKNKTAQQILQEKFKARVEEKKVEQIPTPKKRISPLVHVKEQINRQEKKLKKLQIIEIIAFILAVMAVCIAMY